MSHREREIARNGRAAGFGAVGSAVLHAGLFAVLVAVEPAPELDFEFELPTEVEFGLTEAMEAVDEAAAGAQTVEAEAVEDTSQAGADAVGDAGVDAAIADAGVDAMDAGVDADAGDASDDADAGDAGDDAGDGGADADLIARGPPASLDGPSEIPAGAQIAIRFDMARVRASPLNGEVRRLLASIPDWRLILNGSGIDPINDLERLLLASPNLQRSQLVMAGRHAHPDEGEQYIRDVVARFGAARSTPIRWRERFGVNVANWPNEDETTREIAIVGPRHFTISRPDDLQRVLSVARARENENVDDEELESAVGADALLSMGAEDAFSIEVEGARGFIRRGDTSRIPTRLRAAVRQEATEVNVRAVGTFENDAEAERAVEYWSAYRDAQAESLNNVFTRSLYRRVTAAELVQDGRRIRFSIALSTGQARLALSYVQGMLRASRRRRQRARPVPSMSATMSAPMSTMSAMEPETDTEQTRTP